MNEKKQFEQYAQREYTDYLTYQKLAETEKDPGNKRMLQKFSEHEKEHFDFWKNLRPDFSPKHQVFFIDSILIMKKILGLTFTIKFFEVHEKKVVAEYKNLLSVMPPDKRSGLEKMIRDEEEHEHSLISQISEGRIKYIGFIALGLADAIIEITGVHAGFLGVTGSTLIAGISGIIVGFAAAISMSSAAYLQAKSDQERSAFTSAIVTGLSYIIAVVVLALPYFMTREMLTAFLSSALVGVIMIAGFTFYSSVVSERNFFREFSESTLLMFGTAAATFALGKVLGEISGIKGSGFTQ